MKSLVGENWEIFFKSGVIPWKSIEAWRTAMNLNLKEIVLSELKMLPDIYSWLEPLFRQNLEGPSAF